MKYHLCDLLSSETIVHESTYGYQYAIALGNFDGMHLGHQNVIATAVNNAMHLNCRSAVITFYPHPGSILHNHPSRRISDADVMTSFHEILSLDEKTALMKQLGVDDIFVIKFTYEFSMLSPDEFISLLCKHFKITYITTGYNFRFGHCRSGNINTMYALGYKYDFKFNVLHRMCVNGYHVSSSWLRHILKTGCVQFFNELVGRSYTIQVKVEKNHKICIGNVIYTMNAGYTNISFLLPFGAYVCYVTPANERRKLYLLFFTNEQFIVSFLQKEFVDAQHGNAFVLIDTDDDVDMSSKGLTVTLHAFIMPCCNSRDYDEIKTWVDNCVKAVQYFARNDTN